jgi:hypothetical protein
MKFSSLFLTGAALILFAPGLPSFVSSPAVAQSAESWSPEEGFRSLFNGKDLTGWSFSLEERFDGKTESSDGRFTAGNGILAVQPQKEGQKRIGKIQTVEMFPKDFVLRLEFRASVNADSGIFLRGKQLQCRDYLVAGPYKELKKYKAQDWNVVEITVKDGVAHCTCNGEILEEAYKLPENGPIGFEADRGLMEYRRVRIKM